MNTPFNIIHVSHWSLEVHSPILTNRRMAGQYHYLWTGQLIKNGIPRDVSSTNRKTSVMYFM